MHLSSLMLFLLSCLLISGNSTLLAQNLIPDPSFEEIPCPDNEINSIEVTRDWYAISSDAYLIHINCPLDPAVIVSISALNHGTLPYRGLGYISLEAILSANGYFITEGIATELTKTLEPDKYYYFEMATMNYDISKGPDHPDMDCNFPGRYVEVHFSDVPIFKELETQQIGTQIFVTGININSIAKLIDRSSDEIGYKNYTWEPFWDCFAGEGDEKYIAITGNNYQLDSNADCIESNNPGILLSAGHGIDAVQLIELPLSIDTIINMCPDGIEIVLEDILEGPYADKGEYIWEDGQRGSVRKITEEGVYKIDFNLPCTTIPITLTVEEFPCKAEIYVPNVFSPNEDGINDELLPGIFSIYEMRDYHFQIFNRWGQLVFESKDQSQAWNGMIKGERANEGVYVWKIQYRLEFEEGLDVTEFGDVLLMR